MTGPAQPYVRLGELTTTVGLVGVYRVPNMLPMPADYTRAYAAVVEAPTVEFVGDPIAMLITVHDPRDADESVRELGIGSWSGKERTVDNVYAEYKFRGGGPPSSPVAVGRFLLQCEAFTHHSVDRNEGGDRWAREVGGSRPLPNVPFENSATLDACMRDALDRLRATDWGRQFRREGGDYDDVRDSERGSS